MNFGSDNTRGISPEILNALARANEGSANPYGNDEATARLTDRFSEVFEREVTVFPVATGTAANALGLACVAPPYGAIYCHEAAHIHADECGAPEFYTGGAKLVLLRGEGGKVTAGELDAHLAVAGAGVVHHVQPAAVSITQESECGRVYTLEEVAAIAEVARGRGLKLQMDGARFANAVAALDCSPAEATWKAGVDILAFGATKNGAMAAEAVVFFDPDLAEGFAYRRKRAGHLFSKMRFLSVQLEAYLADDLWLRNARHANAMARRLHDGLAKVAGVEFLYPVEANELFPRLPGPVQTALRDQGFQFRPWGAPSAEVVRLVTAFDTPEAEVDRFVETALNAAAAA